MTSHMTTLREMNSGKAAAKGALTFSDPVETLRISMNAAEEVSVAMQTHGIKPIQWTGKLCM